MKKNILYLIAILAMCQGIFAMQLEQAIEDFKKKANEARRFADLGDIQKAWNKFHEGDDLYAFNPQVWEKMTNDLRLYILAAARKRLSNEFWALEHEIQQLINQGKIEDARDKYNKLDAVYVNIKSGIPSGLTTEVYENAIADLEKKFYSQSQTQYQAELKQAQDYANQNTEDGYKKAYEIINRLKALQISDAARLEIKIKQQEAAWKRAQEPVAPVEEKWFFIKQIPGAEPVEKTDWKIQDQKLLLNLDATDAITAESFEDLIQQAQKDNLPFILVMVQSGDATKFFPYFFSAGVLISFVQSWGKDIKFINPINREQVTNIAIYVMDDNKTLHLLKDKADISYLEKLIDYKGFTDDEETGRRTHNYELKPELTEPGMAKTFINNLYKEQGKPALFNL